MDTLQKRLKIARITAEMTQEQLAEKSGVARNTVSMLESVPGRSVRSDILARLAVALDVSTDYLLFGDVVEHA